MTYLLLQIVESVSAVKELGEDRSDLFLMTLVGVVMAGVLIWRWETRQNKEDERVAKREDYARMLSERYAEAIEKISDSVEETAKAIDIIADQGKMMSHRMEQIDQRLEGVEKKITAWGSIK